MRITYNQGLSKSVEFNLVNELTESIGEQITTNQVDLIFSPSDVENLEDLRKAVRDVFVGVDFEG